VYGRKPYALGDALSETFNYGPLNIPSNRRTNIFIERKPISVVENGPNYAKLDSHYRVAINLRIVRKRNVFVLSSAKRRRKLFAIRKSKTFALFPGVSVTATIVPKTADTKHVRRIIYKKKKKS